MEFECECYWQTLEASNCLVQPEENSLENMYILLKYGIEKVYIFLNSF